MKKCELLLDVVNNVSALIDAIKEIGLDKYLKSHIDDCEVCGFTDVQNLKIAIYRVLCVKLEHSDVELEFLRLLSDQEEA